MDPVVTELSLFLTSETWRELFIYPKIDELSLRLQFAALPSTPRTFLSLGFSYVVSVESGR
jgi:hypothetical protein